VTISSILDETNSVDITAASLRDGRVETFTVTYDWVRSLITSPRRIYLSFDPYTEGVESDRDNFSFIGRKMVEFD
jgi:hypothetical protein